MITTTMNKDEILKEFQDYSKKQHDVLGNKCDKLYNKARIVFRKTKEPVYVGTFKINFRDTTYYASTMMNFPLGTRTSNQYYSMLINTYVILVLPSSGKKIALYINPKKESLKMDDKVISYNLHFFKRFYERMTNLDPSLKSFEFLAEYYFKNRKYGASFHTFPDIKYKDYPGPTVLSRNVNGLEFGWLNTDSAIIQMNTFVTEDMFGEEQLEKFGEDSRIIELLRDNIELVKNNVPDPYI